MVDVVIPVYKPDKKTYTMLNRIAGQKYRVNRIILINTERKYFMEELLRIDDRIEVYHITREEFDHGATRHMGMELSKADYVLFMTMDAVPADRNLVGNLLKGFKQTGKNGERAAVVYGRQLPAKDCRMQEKYARMYNYPEKSMVKTMADVKRLGIKAFFSSDVCAMYDREIYYINGGFGKKMIFNEDMIYAAAAMRNGYAVVYCSKASVIHSHNHSCMEQLRRNFDIGVSHADNMDVFESVPPEGEGIRLMLNTALYLCRNGHCYEVPYLIISSAVKYMGYRLGRNYKKLGRKTVMRLTSDKNYWNAVKE